MYVTINGIHQRMIFCSTCVRCMYYIDGILLKRISSIDGRSKYEEEKKCFIFQNFLNNSSDAVSCGLSQYNH